MVSFCLISHYTVITQTSIVGATKIFFDPAKTDFRDNEYAVIFRPSDETSTVVRLSTVVGDGANLASSLTTEVRAGDHVVPAFFGHLDDRDGIVMGPVAGEVPVGAFILDFRTQFNRPGSAAVITAYDGLNVLERRPIVTSIQADERFSIHPHLVDSLTGKYANKISWLHPYVGGGRQFVVQRKRSSTDMDYWRDFLTAAGGMRVPFLMSTWREDLVLAATPPAGALQIEVQGHEYALDYFPHDTYKRFVFTNPVVLLFTARPRMPKPSPIRQPSSRWKQLQDFNARDWTQYSEAGTLRIIGVIRTSSSVPDFGKRADPPGRLDIWNFANVARIAEQISYPLLPIYIQQAPDPSWSALPYRSQPELDLTEGPHLGYDFQWFSFAVILGLGYPFFVRRQDKARLRKMEQTHDNSQSAP